MTGTTGTTGTAVNGAIGPDMLWVEVSDERFTEPVQRTFKRVGEPQAVLEVDIGAGSQRVRALELVDGEVVPGPAHACVVEDSGSGLVWLVYGGAAGLWVGEGEAPTSGGSDFDAFLLVEREALVFA